MGNDTKSKVLLGKINAKSVTYFGDEIYATETFVFELESFAISRAASNCLREGFQLPNASTLTGLTSTVKIIDYITYMKQIFLKT